MVGKPVTTLKRSEKNMFDFIEVGLHFDIKFLLQWNLSFGTPLHRDSSIRRHKIWSRKNVHIIFVS